MFMKKKKLACYFIYFFFIWAGCVVYVLRKKFEKLNYWIDWIVGYFLEEND